MTSKLGSAASNGSFERQQCILAALEERTMTLERLTAKFFEPPLYSCPNIYEASRNRSIAT